MTSLKFVSVIFDEKFTGIVINNLLKGKSLKILEFFVRQNTYSQELEFCFYSLLKLRKLAWGSTNKTKQKNTSKQKQAVAVIMNTVTWT